jgi:hypothetical protein
LNEMTVVVSAGAAEADVGARRAAMTADAVSAGASNRLFFFVRNKVSPSVGNRKSSDRGSRSLGV